MVSFDIPQFYFQDSLLSFSNSLVVSALLAFASSVVILLLLLKTGYAWRLATDVPNDRSLHTRPTPRVGGWGITPASAVLILIFARSLWPLAVLALALGLLSHFDDRQGLSARYRFAGHVIAAIALVCVVPPPYFGWLAIPVVFSLVWVSNLYNFMDGANGLAGGMAVIGFGCYSLSAGVRQPELAIAALIVACAALGFLLFNFPFAKVFLGDAGSIPLGFLAGGMGYWGWAAGAWAFWFPVFVFSPFIADASATLLKRLLRRERFWEAHRQHYYQRMIGMAGVHWPVVLQWYGLMVFGITLASYSRLLPGQWPFAVLIGWMLFLVTLGWTVDRRWRRAPAY
ncbi:glycosyl transferase [Pararobbsia alpina]|uniref:Undecaprenyl-phosphate alpha-N-acetylglucosaminyl 1-phosphate transferase n=1 Tax=Pararobbsia alpina TaxID=621374 RepID=A0A6S7BJY9_9BURK|nr:glycosyl transferase [Pararobbsia alpina]CAB3803177.1 Undecaprenyl-phosphate alpha-N-acetylglucosaminyl 1-phosphate transferase [Pararobbsia alpina]